MSVYRRAKVFVQNMEAGILSETEDGYEFAYSPVYLEKETALAVSLTMPLSSDPYKSNVLMPFFDGLIPEGWLLEIVSKNWKINTSDRFGLLLVACRDCIGDVRIEEVADEGR